MLRFLTRSGRRAAILSLTLLLTFGAGGCLGEGDLTEPHPYLLTTVSGGDQSVRAGAQASAPLVVRVFDQFGAPLEDVQVSWSVSTGGGTLSPTSSRTGSEGTTQTSYTAGSSTGQATIVASVTGIGSVVFVLTIVP